MQTSYSQTLTSWEIDVLTDIKTVANGKDCSSLNNGDSSVYYENLFFYGFQGFTSGCDCRDISYYNSNYYNVDKVLDRYHCSYNQSRAYCTDIYTSAPNKQLTTIFANHACGKRIKGYNMANQRRNRPHGCLFNEKACGTGDNKFCMKKTENCPITVIDINAQNKQNYNKTLQLDSTNSLSFSFFNESQSFTQNYPVTLFKMNMGDYMCKYDYQQTTRTSSRRQYILTYGSYKDCSGNQDVRFKKMFSINENELFTNNLGASFKYKFPYRDRGFYVYNKNINYGIFSREYVPWSISGQCQGKVNGLYNNKSNFDKVVGYQYANEIINSICFTFTAIFTIMLIANLCGADLPCFPGSGESEFKRVELTKKIVYFIIKFIQLPFMILAWQSSDKLMVFYQDIAQSHCSDNITNQVFNTIYDNLKNDVFNYNKTQVILLIIMFLLDVSILVKQFVIDNIIRQAQSRKQDKEMAAVMLNKNSNNQEQVESQSSIEQQVQDEQEMQRNNQDQQIQDIRLQFNPDRQQVEWTQENPQLQQQQNYTNYPPNQETQNQQFY